MTGQTYIKGYLCEDKGMWVVRARVPDAKSGKRKLLSKSTGYKVLGNNKRKAEIKMREIVALWEEQAKIGKPVGYNATFKDSSIDWLEMKKLSVRSNTLQSYKVTINTHLIPKLGNIKMCDLTRQHLQQYFQELNGVLSPNTMKKHKALIHSIIENACLNGIVPNNVAVSLELPKVKRFEGKALNENELKDLLEKVKHKPEPLKAIIILAVIYGLRRSEICGLRWSDIDFNQNVMHIRNTVTSYNGLTIESEQTKTASSRRDIILISNTVPYLENLKKISKSDKVCSHTNGKAMRPDYISKSAVKFLKECGFEDVRLHDLRHTAATVLAKRLPPKLVQTFLGHSDIQTTLNIYTHISTSDKINTSETMSSLLENI